MAEVNQPVDAGMEAAKKYFEKQIVTLGERTEEEVVEFEFPFTGEPDDIQYIQKSCGCTDAYFKDGAVRGTLDMKTAGRYQKGSNSVTKSIQVIMNDGKDRWISDDEKRIKPNPEKEIARLTITAVVNV